MKRLALLIVLVSLAIPSYAQNLLLDDYTNSIAAFSLRKLDKDYVGSAIRVVRDSDSSEQDIGFSGDTLDVSSLETFCASTNCGVVIWYNQNGGSDLHSDYLNELQVDDVVNPRIVTSGVVERDAKSKPVVNFISHAAMSNTVATFSPSIRADSSSIFIYFTTDSLAAEASSYESLFQLGSNNVDGTSYTIRSSAGAQVQFEDTQNTGNPACCDFISNVEPTIYHRHHGGQASDSVYAYSKITAASGTATTLSQYTRNEFVLGGAAKNDADPEWNGKIGEVLVFPYRESNSDYVDIFDNMNNYWEALPLGYHPDALLPQIYDSDVVFYNWLETIDTTAVSYWSMFPNASDTIAVWDNTKDYANDLSDDQYADIYLELSSATLSSVVRAEPEWYVLDAGNGKGIEATGAVRLIHKPTDAGNDPFSAGYGGNPATNWCNEISFWYNLHVHRNGLPEGNRLYKRPEIGKRALACAIPAMMEWRENWNSGQAADPPFFGRAALSWAEVYKHAGELLDSATASAYRDFLQSVSQKIINYPGALGANTNLDMFAVRGLAIQYALPDADSTMKAKAKQAIKAMLFGDPNAQLGGSGHTNMSTSTSFQTGVFNSVGCIMEGGHCDWYYQGESLLHMTGALAEATNRGNLTIPDSLAFLESVVDSMISWQSYQVFDDPAINNASGPALATDEWRGGTSYSGRTGSMPIAQQTNKECSDFLAAYYNSEGHFWAEERHGWPSVATMKSSISSKMSSLDGSLKTVYSTASPTTWSSESPWVKINCFLPPIGWYGYISRDRANLPELQDPPFRRTANYNKSFGGPPEGASFWAYKNTDSTGEDYAWFVSAVPHQGTYGGWNGGKVETFWIDSVGVAVQNQRSKSGCDYSQDELAGCWAYTGLQPATHTWGTDEHDDRFTTFRVHGAAIDRPTTWSLQSANPYVEITTKFNDALRVNEETSVQNDNGEEVDTTLTGATFNVTHRFTGVTDGLQVDVTVTTSQEDSLKTLQHTIPIFLRDWYAYPPFVGRQQNMEDPIIERDSSGVWVAMREEDSDADGLPDWVSTRYLRITKDWELASMDSTQSWWIDLAQTESVRLSDSVFTDPYQAKSRHRNIHIDMHGSPGTTILVPSSITMSYTLYATDPTQ